MSVDILLSSNSRSGYSQDLVDLFAKPRGSMHQFRYASKWISAEVLNRITHGSYADRKQEAVLCYIDQATKGIPPRLLPTRYASIVDVREHGSTISIVLQLGNFCKFDKLEDFNATLRAAQPELPDYNDGEIQGKYWLHSDGKALEGIEQSSELSDWERLIEAYYQTPNPVEKMPFYRFEGIADLDSGELITPTINDDDLLYALDGGRKYEVRVYHFHPKEDFSELSLKVSSDDGNLAPLNGDTRALHTRYDRKDYRFETKPLISGADTYLSFRRIEKDSGKLVWEDFLLGVKINASWTRAGIYVSAIAIGFAVPFIVRTLSEPKDWPIIFAAIVGGLIVGLATLFKEKLRF